MASHSGDKPESDRRRGARWLSLAAPLVALAAGCAAFTNPVADGVPVRLMPPELVAPCHADEQPLPLNLLRQLPPPVYRLAPGDVLGVYIEGVLGERTQPLPLHVAPPLQEREQRRFAPALGYPLAVEEDGRVSLPQVGPLPVSGRTLEETREAIREAYVRQGLLKRDTDRVLVTLLQQRQAQVLVVRQEAVAFGAGPLGIFDASKRGTGQVVELPGYENDVLHALLRTGGLPGLDARNEILIQRDAFLVRDGPGPPVCIPTTRTIRIPLRLPCGAPPPFRSEDVVLRSGDVVFLESRDAEVFYTAGLLPPGEYALPRDRDLDVLEAIALVRGPLVNGAFAVSNLSGTLINPGIGNPSPSLLTVVRRLPGGGQLPIRVDLKVALVDPRERIAVRPGDLLLLQEDPSEALTRYLTQTFFNFNLNWQVIHDRFVNGIIDVSAPDRLPGRLTQFNNTLPR